MELAALKQVAARMRVVVGERIEALAGATEDSDEEAELANLTDVADAYDALVAPQAVR